MPAIALKLLVITLILARAQSKIYSHCELAKELLEVHEIPRQQVATWVCIAEHEANMNTSATNRVSGDHGLFQISELFWCSPPGYACGVSCTDLRNDDIEDDVICAKRIYREHKRLSGDGFNAWVVYKTYCGGDVSRYIKGCFESASKVGADTSATSDGALPSSSAVNLDDRSKTKVISTLAPTTYSTTISTTVIASKVTSLKSTTDGLQTSTTDKYVTTAAITRKVTGSTSTERVKEKEEAKVSVVKHAV